MACNSIALAGLAHDCEPSMGGIKEAYIALKADITGVTVTSDQITAIASASGTAKPFRKFAFRKNTGNVTTTLNRADENGTLYYGSDINLVFTRMETTKRKEVSALAVNDLVVVIRDANGKLWYYGKDFPVVASGAEVANTGTNRTDRNGYTIQLHDDSLELPYEVLEGTSGVDIESLTD